MIYSQNSVLPLIYSILYSFMYCVIQKIKNLNIKIYNINIKYVYVHIETIVSSNVLIYDYIIIKS